jgi:quinol-cytochrome oxidoreductase complex cytochrome b subunit
MLLAWGIDVAITLVAAEEVAGASVATVMEQSFVVKKALLYRLYMLRRGSFSKCVASTPRLTNNA